MDTQERLVLLDKALPDIRELKQCLIAFDIGVLKSVEIQFLGDDEPTKIRELYT